MAVRTMTQLQAEVNSMLPDNTAGEISAMDVRQLLTDMLDSMPNLAGATFAGTVAAATPAQDGDLATKAYVDAVAGGVTPPTPTFPTLRFGTSTDATPEAGELTIVGANGRGTIDAYAGTRHHLIARLATEPDIVSVIYSDDPSQDNALGAFTKFGSTIDILGAGHFNVWVSNQALLHPNAATLVVR